MSGEFMACLFTAGIRMRGTGEIQLPHVAAVRAGLGCAFAFVSMYDETTNPSQNGISSYPVPSVA